MERARRRPGNVRGLPPPRRIRRPDRSVGPRSVPHPLGPGGRGPAGRVTMPDRTPGGVIHTYQKYDPVNVPGPTRPPPDMVSPAFEHLLEFGDLSEFSDEDLARAVHLDASQIAG